MQPQLCAHAREGIAFENAARVALVDGGLQLGKLCIQPSLLRLEGSDAGSEKLLDRRATPGLDLSLRDAREILREICGG
jgi:hypothetical protein